MRALNEIAANRGQALSQMALAWVLRDEVVTTALIGASRPSQIIENVKALDAAPFTEEELAKIEEILAKKKGIKQKALCRDENCTAPFCGGKA